MKITRLHLLLIIFSVGCLVFYSTRKPIAPEEITLKQITLCQKFLKNKNLSGTTKTVFISANKTIIRASNSQSRKDEYPKFLDVSKGFRYTYDKK
jgi:hypothetical protein